MALNTKWMSRTFIQASVPVRQAQLEEYNYCR